MYFMLSLTYRFMKFIGLNFSEEEYGQISFLFAVKRAFRGLMNAMLLKYYVLCYFISAKLSKNTSFIVACYGSEYGERLLYWL